MTLRGLTRQLYCKQSTIDLFILFFTDFHIWSHIRIELISWKISLALNKQIWNFVWKVNNSEPKFFGFPLSKNTLMYIQTIAGMNFRLRNRLQSGCFSLVPLNDQFLWSVPSLFNICIYVQSAGSKFGRQIPHLFGHSTKNPVLM